MAMTKINVIAEPAASGTLTIPPTQSIIVATNRITSEYLSDGGYTRVIPKHSRTYKRYDLTWDSLSQSDYETLKTLFLTTFGVNGSFVWETERLRLIERPVFRLISKSVYRASASAEVIP